MFGKIIIVGGVIMILNSEQKSTLRAMVSEFNFDVPPIEDLNFIHSTRLRIDKVIHYGMWSFIYNDDTITFDMRGQLNASL